MPQRFLRPGLKDSERWNRCSFAAQSLYVRIIMLVDDHGRYDARPAILKGHAFALRDDVTMEAVLDLRNELTTQNLIEVHQKDGQTFLQVTNWQERARGPSKYPDPKSCAPLRSAAESCGILRNPASLVLVPAMSHESSPKSDIYTGDEVEQKLPATFPKDEQDAIARCMTAGVPDDFIKDVYHKALSRGGKDAREIPIAVWPSYVKTEWKYEQNRKQEKDRKPAPHPQHRPEGIQPRML